MAVVIQRQRPPPPPHPRAVRPHNALARHKTDIGRVVVPVPPRAQSIITHQEKSAKISAIFVQMPLRITLILAPPNGNCYDWCAP